MAPTPAEPSQADEPMQIPPHSGIMVVHKSPQNSVFLMCQGHRHTIMVHIGRAVLYPPGFDSQESLPFALCTGFNNRDILMLSLCGAHDIIDGANSSTLSGPCAFLARRSVQRSSGCRHIAGHCGARTMLWTGKSILQPVSPLRLITQP